MIGALDRRVLGYRENDGVRRVRDGRDADLRRALGDEGELRPGADADVDRVGGDCLLHARTAAEADHFEIYVVLVEYAGLGADLERHELKRPGLWLTDPHFHLRACRLPEHKAKCERRGDKGCWRHRSLAYRFLVDPAVVH